MEREERYLQRISNVEASATRVLVTLLFTDLVGSTRRAVELGDRAWSRLLETHHAQVRELFDTFGGHEIDCAGDGFFATFDTASDAVLCGDAITESVRSLGLQVRAGVHTGECERLRGRVRGIAVHTAARLVRLAGPGEVLVTTTVRDVVSGSGIRFEDRGDHDLDGVPGSWRLFVVATGDERDAAETLVGGLERSTHQVRWRTGPRTAAYSGRRDGSNG